MIFPGCEKEDGVFSTKKETMSAGKLASGLEKLKPADLSKPPLPMSRGKTHEAVLRVLDRLPRGKILDAGCGQGALALRLSEMGFAVVCCDSDPSSFKLSGTECRRVDLNENFPFGSGEFECVVYSDVVEHLENPWHLMRETRRILKPGGRVVVAMPNIINVESRLRTLFFGFPPSFKPSHASHINPVSLPELLRICARVGMTVEEIEASRISPRTRLFWPLIAVIRLVARLTRRKKRIERMLDLLASDSILLGDKLIVVAKKGRE